MAELINSSSLKHRERPEVAQKRIAAFRKRFGEVHLLLVQHAAFPLAFTPDLLYRLWANFQRDIHGKNLNIPWIAVADLLLSPLCNEVGQELYEMDITIRNELLKILQAHPEFGQQRIEELSNFLLNYIQQHLYSNDPDIHEFAKVQRWTALAYTQPTKAARELAKVLTELDQNDKVEQIRVASLIETFAEPLSGFAPLIAYARGIGHLARGDVRDAISLFVNFMNMEKNSLERIGYNFYLPNEILSEMKREQDTSFARSYLGFRPDDVNHVMQSLLAGMSCLLVGVSGVGKTSLLQHLVSLPVHEYYLGKNKDRFIFLSFNANELTRPSALAYYSHMSLLLEPILADYQLLSSLDKNSLAITNEEVAKQLLFERVESILSLCEQCILVFVLDEFDVAFAKVEPQFFYVLQELRSRVVGHICYVAASTNTPGLIDDMSNRETMNNLLLDLFDNNIWESNLSM